MMPGGTRPSGASGPSGAAGIAGPIAAAAWCAIAVAKSSRWRSSVAVGSTDAPKHLVALKRAAARRTRKASSG